MALADVLFSLILVAGVFFLFDGIQTLSFIKINAVKEKTLRTFSTTKTEKVFKFPLFALALKY